MRFKVKEVQAAVRACGMTMRSTGDGEYRLNYRGGSEATAYYTTDLADVLETALAMLREQDERRRAAA